MKSDGLIDKRVNAINILSKLVTTEEEVQALNIVSSIVSENIARDKERVRKFGALLYGKRILS